MVVFRLHILMSSTVAFVVICLREDACWSLSGSKGLTNLESICPMILGVNSWQSKQKALRFTFFLF